MLNVVQMQLKNNLMVLTHRNWNPAKCLFTLRACNLLFEGANLSYSCLIILFTFSRYRKNVKKMNYIERWAKRPSNPFTAVFYPSVSVLAFEVQIYGRRSTAVPVKRTVRSPMSRVCKPVRVNATGAYGYGYGLGFSNPRPTRTRGAGTKRAQRVLHMNVLFSKGIRRYP